MESEVCDGHWELSLLQVRQPIKAADLVHAVTLLFLSVPLNLKIAKRTAANVQFSPREGLVREGWWIHWPCSNSVPHRVVKPLSNDTSGTLEALKACQQTFLAVILELRARDNAFWSYRMPT